MHEGLIVIREKDLSLQFASRPAIAVLKLLPQAGQLEEEGNFNDKNEGPIQFDMSDLEKPIFKLSQVSVRD